MKAILLFTLLFLCACSSSTKVTDGNGASQQAKESLGRVDLTDELRRIPGLIVRGKGASATFQVRGVNSFNAGLQPLFVINGQAVTSYASVYDIVTSDNFKSARLLKESETTLYGVRGANGVIVIKTKN